MRRLATAVLAGALLTWPLAVPAAAAAPTVVATPVTGVADTSATAHCAVTSTGGEDTRVFVQLRRADQSWSQARTIPWPDYPTLPASSVPTDVPIPLSGLTASTGYVLQCLARNASTVAAGHDVVSVTKPRFTTLPGGQPPPPPPPQGGTRVAAGSDVHEGDSSCEARRVRISNLAIGFDPALTLLTGDVADSGTASQYPLLRTSWGRLSPLQAVPGNHDYRVSGAAGFKAYFGLSRTYRAVDVGRWRVYLLDSNISSASGSAQNTWLKADLAAHPGRPILAVWHHPRYASYHGDTSGVQPMIDLLAAAHADLVVNGHDHLYQRSGQLAGVRYLTNATSCETSRNATLDSHYQVKVADNGLIELTLRDASYSWAFVDEDGRVRDSGTTAVHNLP